jgi:hypothetical protein
VTLLSDGISSFASFTYANPAAVQTAMDRVVGFDAGDTIKSDVILNLGMDATDVFPLMEQNVFQIDGNPL